MDFEYDFETDEKILEVFPKDIELRGAKFINYSSWILKMDYNKLYIKKWGKQYIIEFKDLINVRKKERHLYRGGRVFSIKIVFLKDNKENIIFLPYKVESRFMLIYESVPEELLKLFMECFRKELMPVNNTNNYYKKYNKILKYYMYLILFVLIYCVAISIIF